MGGWVGGWTYLLDEPEFLSLGLVDSNVDVEVLLQAVLGR